MTDVTQDAMMNDGDRPYFIRDPRSRLPVNVDWSAWLTLEGTTITGSAWVVDTGLTTDNPAFTTTLTSVFVSGGVVDKSYTLRNTITCANGSIDSRSIRVVCRDR